MIQYKELIIYSLDAGQVTSSSTMTSDMTTTISSLPTSVTPYASTSITNTSVTTDNTLDRTTCKLICQQNDITVGLRNDNAR